jgi:hypothetical protein
VLKLRWRLQIALISILAVAVGVRVLGVWEAVQSDNEVIDSEVLVQRLVAVDGARLVVDERSLSANGWIRNCDEFYFRSAPDVQWIGRRSTSLPDLRTEGCLFIACGNPEEYLPTAAHPWRAVAEIPSPGRGAVDIFVIGTCDLDLPERLRADPILWTDLIRAEGFEGGTPPSESTFGSKVFPPTMPDERDR